MSEVFSTYQSVVAQQLINEILNRSPHLDVKVGQPIRRVFIDPFATIISNLYYEDFLTKQKYQLDVVSGLDLDTFARNFGFSRKRGTFASGIITCSRQTVDENNEYSIGVGTVFNLQTAFADETIVSFIASDNYTLTRGATSIEIPVIALETGNDGNILAGREWNMSPPPAGITRALNVITMSGGTDEETDDEFKVRMKQTLLKSIVGVEDYYENICLNSDSISAVNVIEASELWEEEVQLTGTSTVDLRFDDLYFNSESVSASETILSIRDTDYTLTYSSGTLARKTGSNIQSGSVVIVRYEYEPELSRGVGTIDIYLKGNAYSAATEEHIFEAGVDDYYLAKPPVVDLPNTITVYNSDGTVDVILDITTDYILDNESTGASLNLQNSKKDSSKITFDGGISTTYDGQRFRVEDYSYNSLVYDIQSEIDINKAITTDCLVHFGNEALLDVSLNIMLSLNYDWDEMVNNVEDELNNFFDDMGFVEAIQFSDIIDAVHNVDGVDNVRVTSIDLDEVNKTEDFYLTSDQYPVLNTVSVLRKSRNTW